VNRKCAPKNKLFTFYFFLSNRSLNRGNFIELLRWASSTDPVALSILEDSDRNATYLSPTIQNELISLLAKQIRQQISEKVILL
jgi:hypothetical protein